MYDLDDDVKFPWSDDEMVYDIIVHDRSLALTYEMQMSKDMHIELEMLRDIFHEGEGGIFDAVCVPILERMGADFKTEAVVEELQAEGFTPDEELLAWY